MLGAGQLVRCSQRSQSGYGQPWLLVPRALMVDDAGHSSHCYARHAEKYALLVDAVMTSSHHSGTCICKDNIKVFKQPKTAAMSGWCCEPFTTCKFEARYLCCTAIPMERMSRDPEQSNASRLRHATDVTCKCKGGSFQAQKQSS